MQTVLTIISVVSTVACICCLLWLMRLIRSRKKLDRSFWMYCRKCDLKWRPTAYGPPAPDDYYCPRCTSSTHVRWHPNFTLTEVPEYEERSNNEN